jgi:hypothetical protein
VSLTETSGDRPEEIGGKGRADGFHDGDDAKHDQSGDESYSMAVTPDLSPANRMNRGIKNLLVASGARRPAARDRRGGGGLVSWTLCGA